MSEYVSNGISVGVDQSKKIIYFPNGKSATWEIYMFVLELFGFLKQTQENQIRIMGSFHTVQGGNWTLLALSTCMNYTNMIEYVYMFICI